MQRRISRFCVVYVSRADTTPAQVFEEGWVRVSNKKFSLFLSPFLPPRRKAKLLLLLLVACGFSNRYGLCGALSASSTTFEASHGSARLGCQNPPSIPHLPCREKREKKLASHGSVRVRRLWFHLTLVSISHFLERCQPYPPRRHLLLLGWVHAGMNDFNTVPVDTWKQTHDLSHTWHLAPMRAIFNPYSTVYRIS